MHEITGEKPPLPFGLWVVIILAGLQGLYVLLNLILALTIFDIWSIIILAIYSWIAFTGVKLTIQRKSSGVERLFLLYTLNIINTALIFIGGFDIKNQWPSIYILAVNAAILFHLNFLRIYFLDLRLNKEEQRRDYASGIILIILVIVLIVLTIGPIASAVITGMNAGARAEAVCLNITAGDAYEYCAVIETLSATGANFNITKISPEACKSFPNSEACITAIARSTKNASLCSTIEKEKGLCLALATGKKEFCENTSEELKKYCEKNSS